MKRIIPILLILGMLLSFAVTAHAEEVPTDTVTLTAPTLCSVQTAVNETDETLHDVRFLATVSDLRGTALGMEIRANFVLDGEQKSVLYNAADGLEGDTVYSSVKETVDGVTKSVTAAELAGDENAKGIFAAIIKGVPSNLTVTFSVTVYVKDGDTVVSSPVTMAVDQNGVFADVALSQNFDSAATLEEAGITRTLNPTKCNGWDVKIEDGKLSIPGHGWHDTPDYYLTLASADKLAGAKTYLLDMDLTFTGLSVFTLMMNNDNALSTTSRPNNQTNTMAVSMRQGTDGNYKSPGNNNNVTTSISKNLVANFIKWDSAGGGQTTMPQKDNMLVAVDGEQESVSFRLSVLVESTDDGCRVSLFLDGAYVTSYTFGASYNVTANSAIVLWAQQTAVTIDNLKLLTINN